VAERYLVNTLSKDTISVALVDLLTSPAQKFFRKREPPPPPPPPPPPKKKTERGALGRARPSGTFPPPDPEMRSEGLLRKSIALRTDHQKSYGDGEFSNCTNFSSLIFPLQEYFFRVQELFSGLLAVHEFFSLSFPLHEFFFVLRPPTPLHNFSNGSSLELALSVV